MIVRSKKFNRESVIEPVFPALAEKERSPKTTKIKTSRFFNEFQKSHQRIHRFSSLDYVDEIFESKASVSPRLKFNRNHRSQQKSLKQSMNSYFQFATPRHKQIKEQQNSSGFKPYKTKFRLQKKDNWTTGINRYPGQERLRTPFYDSYWNLDSVLSFRNQGSRSPNPLQFYTEPYQIQERIAVRSNKRRPLLFNLFKNKIKLVSKHLASIQ